MMVRLHRVSEPRAQLLDGLFRHYVVRVSRRLDDDLVRVDAVRHLAGDVLEHAVEQVLCVGVCRLGIFDQFVEVAQLAASIELSYRLHQLGARAELDASAESVGEDA